MAKSDFEQRKELVDLKLENDIKFHEMKMEQLKYARETLRLQHEWELERNRIKSAEIRKAFERKQASQYPRGKRW